MKYFKSLGLCLVAVLALSAVVAATASAEIVPLFLFSGTNKVFSSKGNGGKLETTKGEEVNCTAETDTGEIEGEKQSRNARDILISYTGCTAKILTKTLKCKSSGAAEEEIKTFDLLGRLGYTNKAEKKVGMLFNPETGKANNPNNLFAAFSCTTTGETDEIKVKGSVIALITPVNKLVDPSEHFTVTFEKGAKTKGELGEDRKFEGEPENELLTATTITIKEKPTAPYIKSAIEGIAEIFPLQSTEIMA
jgi:hypothetical protein